MEYTPSTKLLDKYADILINYGLNGGNGIKPKEVVVLQVPDCAKPMLYALKRAVLKSGGYPILRYMPDRPDGMSKEDYELSSDDQLEFYPDKYFEGLIAQTNHLVVILSDTDKHDLEGVDSKKIMKVKKALKPYYDLREAKETKGDFSWTLALYPTQAFASEVGMTLEEYWNEVITACYLNDDNPVDTWKNIQKSIDTIKNKLTALKIQKVHVKAENIDLTVGIGSTRKWLGGSGKNIPSFEVFVSPDARMTEGYIYFNQPLYRFGNLIKDVRLEFKEGKIINSSASVGEELLKEMIAVENANRIGEFSLTDSRLSKITKLMGETLFDENIGGKYGNTHIAIGMAYKDSYNGDPKDVSKKQWEELGFNESAIHTDIMSTENRKVTAYLEDGSSMVIYENGVFTI